MLKPEVAHKQLEQLTSDDGFEQMLARAAKLPTSSRSIGYALLGRGPDGSEYDYGSWDERYDNEHKQTAAFGRLSVAARRKLLKTLCPPLAGAFELTLEHMLRLPFQGHYGRRAFRAPQNPELLNEAQFDWLAQELRSPLARVKLEVLSVEWLAAWCPYLGGLEYSIGRMFSAVIDAGGKDGQAVFDVLYESATGEHEVGSMGRHVCQGLLGSSREDAWELMEKMLLAAQRQEGLRQSILESVDEAHPEAFRRMLRIIVDEKLARFSAVARAVDVWLGMQWDSASVKTINDTCQLVLELLEDKQQQQAALKGDDPVRAFHALWAMAFDDVMPSLTAAEKLTKHESPEMRLVAVYHLRQAGLPAAQPALVACLSDENLCVAVHALDAVQAVEGTDKAAKKQQEKLFSALEELFARLPPKPRKVEELVWPWTAREIRRTDVASSMVNCIGSLPPSRLVPYIEEFDPANRARACRFLAAQKKWNAETRENLVRLIGDASQDVRSAAFDAFAEKPLTPPEAEQVESYLTRKAGDLRRGVVQLLLKQKDGEAVESAQRLAAAGNASQRLAGLELLRELAEADRHRDRCFEIASEFRESRRKITKAEQTQLDLLEAAGAEQVTLENGLGLFDPAERSPRIEPKKRKTQAVTAATIKLIQELDRLVHQHRAETVTVERWNGEVEEPLGGIRWFPGPNWNKPATEQLDKLPLKDLWLEWDQQRPASQRDKDGCELLRAWQLLELTSGWRFKDLEKWMGEKSRSGLKKHMLGGKKRPKLKYSGVVQGVLFWLVRLNTPDNAVDVCQDVVETAFALLPASDHEALVQLAADWTGSSRHFWQPGLPDDWRAIDFCDDWFNAPQGWLTPPGTKLNTARQTRQWQLQRWQDEPVEGALRHRAGLEQVMRAYDAGAATLADLMDELIGPLQSGFRSLNNITVPRLDKDEVAFLERHPEVAAQLDRIRERVLEIELPRGDLPTPATGPAVAMGSFFGVETLVRALSALGKERFKQDRYSWREQTGRPLVLTSIVKSCYPAPEDTPAEFRKQLKAAVKNGAFPEEKVLQLAFLAPQWTRFVQEYYGWNGLDEGLYWYLAHMRYVTGGAEEEAALAAGETDDTTEEDSEDDENRPQKLSAWQRLVLERTPLSEEERGNGVVDVDWFHRTFALLGKKKWEAIADASRFASTAAQARRAKFIADVLLGRIKRQELIEGIRDRKLKEQVRLLGLLPLAKGSRRDSDLKTRYEVLAEYRQYARTLSSMSRPDAELAAEIGLQNLAQLAGYQDPLRLEWAMEAESTQDLLAGPIVVTQGDVSMTLELDDRAQPQVSIQRAGKSLKSLPKTHKKEPPFVELAERSRTLKRQASRVRGSLEAAMCRGDVFTGAELAEIATHALLKPMLERLVLVGDGILGYPEKNGRALRSHDGSRQPVKKAEQLRIAHPADLLATGEWDRWQHECFQAERLQPFKQVFRELYAVTKQERDDGKKSQRYAGQQVNPSQAYALWGQRRWNVDEGVFKVFHGEGFSAVVDFNYGVTTPLEVEGLTLDAVYFLDSDRKLLPMADVPPRIFSEVMRDLDLVVSVAHRGGVDPEASASTVEMRSALLSETCTLLGLGNVSLNRSHATIRGELGEYTVHLGSGVVHRLPGGSVCVVPVHAQHRGRLFLPFADDDPRTAEVISKVLLLARDGEIRDPTILDQLRAAPV